MRKLSLATVFILLFVHVLCAQSPIDQGRIIIVNYPAKNLADFKKIVDHAAILKPYAKVKVGVGTLADKSFHEIPTDGSSWHEYASSNPTPYKFFPDEKLAPFIPAEFVKKNRQLLIEKVQYLKDKGMEAAFIGYELNFLPAAFFEAHPQMMGPRVDHPRRSTQKEFSACIHQAETREMYANMIANMLRSAPEISTLEFKTNDAGAGLCWGDWLYSGANGPAACKNVSMGTTMRMVLETFLEGARRAGKTISIYIDNPSSNFSEKERQDIVQQLPANCYLKSVPGRAVEKIRGSISSTYPVQGIINPINLLQRILDVKDKKEATIFVELRAAYDRGAETPEMSRFIFEMMAKEFAQTSKDFNARLQAHVQDWVGADQAASVQQILLALDQTFQYKQATFPRVHSSYWGVSERFINRPLVAAPQLLKASEESYFLPYVFNTHLEQARMDYMDIHGGKATITPGVVETYSQKVGPVVQQLKSISGIGNYSNLLKDLGTALDMYRSIMLSCGYFAAAQEIRDRNVEAFSKPWESRPKIASWEGHPDFIPFNEIMRKELDNTLSLIEILESGGLKQLIRATHPRYEDSFLLGPDVLNQLKRKRKIMLDHWTDVEQFLYSPHK
jgi:hypothetical protein